MSAGETTALALHAILVTNHHHSLQLSRYHNMNQIQLTGGFISERLFSTADDEETRALLRSSPTLQVLSLKEMPPKSDPPPSQVTYRLILSDGEHYIQTILRTELSSLVQDGSLVKTSIITLEEFLPQNPTQGKRSSLHQVYISSSSEYTRV